MANPFDNPAIFDDPYVYDQTQPAPQPNPQPQPSGDDGKGKSETDKNTKEAKDKAKQDPKASKPNDPDSALSGIKDSFLKMVGVDPAKYKKAQEESRRRADSLYAEIVTGTNASYVYGTKTGNGLRFTERELSTVMGMPYQWMENVDNRIPDLGGFGRKFHEKILSKMPLLVLTPGIPDFMAGYADEKRKTVLNSLLGAVSGQSIDSMANSTDNEMRYYTLQFEAEDYYRYVNSMCTALSVFLNINNELYNGEPIGSINWFDRSKNQIAHNYSYYGGVGLYLNSETQISENFGNDTARSILADKINSMSDIGREVQFLTGISGFDVDLFAGKELNKNAANTEQMTKTGGLGTMKGFMGMIMNGAKTVFAGGKLEFPELWADSSYSSSYSISLKLVSPDYDRRSWYINIGVPLMHLIAMCAPRQVSPNGYVSPFLVRAFYRGFFNIDMGLMSMSVQKGSEGGWTVDGLPTTVDVSIEIKDLYSKLSISSERILGKGASQTFGNVGLITYLANIASVNTNEPDIIRTARLFLALKEQTIVNFPNSIQTKISNSIANIITNRVFRKG